MKIVLVNKEIELEDGYNKITWFALSGPIMLLGYILILVTAIKRGNFKIVVLGPVILQVFITTSFMLILFGVMSMPSTTINQIIIYLLSVVWIIQYFVLFFLYAKHAKKVIIKNYLNNGYEIKIKSSMIINIIITKYRGIL